MNDAVSILLKNLTNIFTVLATLTIFAQNLSVGNEMATQAKKNGRFFPPI